MKTNSQKVIFTKNGAVATRKIEDPTSFTMSYNCVNNYLADASCDPQRMTVTCCQSENGRNFVSFAISEVSRRTATELVDSKYFEAAFNSADNRKSLRNACEKAKRFYMEHILYHNPFPPKQRFSCVIEKSKKTKKEVSNKRSDEFLVRTRRTTSSISVLEGTMSLTSMSSHSQLSTTTPSTPINLKQASPHPSHVPNDSQMVIQKAPTPAPAKTPKKGASDEQRLMNTFNTSEY